MILQALARHPGQWPAALARTTGHPATVVMGALRRLESHGLVTIGEPDGHGRRRVLLLPAGLQALGTPAERPRRRRLRLPTVSPGQSTPQPRRAS